MDETQSLQELENELKRLRPRSLPDRLMQQLECEPGPVFIPAPRRYAPTTSLGSWKWAGWSLAAAATVAMGFFAFSLSQPAVVPVLAPARAPANPVVSAAAVPAPAAVSVGNRYEPVRASSVLYEMKEDGLATLPDNTEGRQVRYRYVDTYTWKNPTTQASLRWSVPRDEVRLVRANLD